ncbi:MAG: glutathione S-transferase [Microvirga sp.]
MKVYFSPASPFVRKVLVAAHELGLSDRIERLACAAHPINRDMDIVAHNPLGQVPTFFTDDGRVLYDSRVICEYLDSLGQGRLLGSGDVRWQALTEQSLADGLLDAALLARYETAVRPEALRWDAWTRSQLDKVNSALDHLEKSVAQFGDRVDIGTITTACGLGYLDFRFPDLGWRTSRPQLARWFTEFEKRPAMKATSPRA